MHVVCQQREAQKQGGGEQGGGIMGGWGLVGWRGAVKFSGISVGGGVGSSRSQKGGRGNRILGRRGMHLWGGKYEKTRKARKTVVPKVGGSKNGLPSKLRKPERGWGWKTLIGGVSRWRGGGVCGVKRGLLNTHGGGRTKCTVGGVGGCVEWGVGVGGVRSNSHQERREKMKKKGCSSDKKSAAMWSSFRRRVVLLWGGSGGKTKVKPTVTGTDRLSVSKEKLCG